MDPRFRGVYFLMAMQLPLEAAAALRDLLVEHAAETSDHSVSDRFVQLLASRRSLSRPAPAWANRYLLPSEQALQVELERLERKVSTASQEKLALEAKLAEAARVKSLLYEQSATGLHEAVAAALRALGAIPVEDQPAAGVSRWTAPSGERVTVTSLVSPQPPTVALLAAAMQRLAAVDGQSPSQRVMIVSHAPAIEPAARGDAFGPEVRAHAADAACQLLSAHELYRVVAAHQRGEPVPAQIWSLQGAGPTKVA